ncbi:MAG TPA: hypothetical protein VET88_05650 [Gammaproteobacteria bacterium]|nr:hypothetical protein [Gammaproteobacteria bacterium]
MQRFQITAGQANIDGLSLHMKAAFCNTAAYFAERRIGSTGAVAGDNFKCPAALYLGAEEEQQVQQDCIDWPDFICVMVSQDFVNCLPAGRHKTTIRSVNSRDVLSGMGIVKTELALLLKGCECREREQQTGHETRP